MSKFVAYTDGGFDMTRGNGASAVVILDEQESKVLYQHVTARMCAFDPDKKQRNNEQELGACLRACKSVPDGSELEIVSDSKYAVGVLSGKNNAYANREIIDRFFQVVKEKKLKVTFRHVKGHNGNRFNEFADQLCTEGMARILHEPLGTVRIWKSEINKCI